ncbi:MAG: lactonase family protein [Akkermansiaceae bacterium]|nr:lactonase family protein [Akkermansiaceae bacterium]
MNKPGPYLHATGEGLTTCALDETTGAITRLQSCPGAENVIWITRAGNVLWVATERYLEPGEISAFAVSETGVCSHLGPTQSSHGGAICHIAVAADARTAFVASYLGGISVHALAPDGRVAAAHQIINYQGSGPDAERQQKSHPHQAVVSPDGKHLYVCDLGADMIWIHRIDASGLGPARGVPAPPGCGPRHLVFHPTLPLLYLFGELDARIHVFAFHDDHLDLRSTHQTLPQDFAGEPAGAAVKFHPSGSTLLVSNRNSDSITVFRVDAAGELIHAACFPTQGRTPRDLAVSPSGRWLLAVNQDSHTVVPFELDPATGLPTGTRGPAFACGSPVCAAFREHLIIRSSP